MTKHSAAPCGERETEKTATIHCIFQVHDPPFGENLFLSCVDTLSRPKKNPLGRVPPPRRSFGRLLPTFSKTQKFSQGSSTKCARGASCEISPLV